jgi:hypothetical protein
MTRLANLDPESLRPTGAADVDRFALSPTELVWRAAHGRLRALGFALRERYDPAWVPSWRKEGHDDTWLEENDFLWSTFEDCIAVRFRPRYVRCRWAHHVTDRARDDA